MSRSEFLKGIEYNRRRQARKLAGKKRRDRAWLASVKREGCFSSVSLLRHAIATVTVERSI